MAAAKIKFFTFAAALALAGLPLQPASADVRILEDRGGALSAYEARVQWLHATGERVIIDGPCLSACTLHLNLPTGQVCATARAVLGFHSALDAQFGLPAPATNAELMRIYPANVRDWINRQGGLWLTMLTGPGRKFLPSCN